MGRGVLVFRSTLPRIKYHKPLSLSELLKLKHELGSEAVVLAGGTDLMIDLKMGVKKPRHLIDIKNVKELRNLTYVRGEGLRIGAATTLRMIEESDIIRSKYVVLWDAVRKMGDISLRNRATLAGNIANASPAADSAPALLVYNAYVELASIRGRRLVPLREFFKGVKKTIMRDDEVILSIRIPEPPQKSVGEYFKATRAAEDLAIVGIAILVSEAEGVVRLAYASVAPTPVLIDGVEELLRRFDKGREFLLRTIELVLNKVSPITDVRATREYRLHLIKYVTAYLLRKYLGMW